MRIISVARFNDRFGEGKSQTATTASSLLEPATVHRSVSLSNAVVAIGVSAMPVFIRLTRAQVMQTKVEDYVEAARAVIAEASFSFLGLGQQPPLPSWGSMPKPPKTTWTTRRLWQCGPVLRFFCWCFL
jgi:ABC-type dipeptide/oligopeptide/nickel transport system permease subunit